MSRAGRFTARVVFTLAILGPSVLHAQVVPAVSGNSAGPTVLPGNVIYGTPQYPPGVGTQRLPAGSIYEATAFKSFLSQVVKNSWFRLEYMSWGFKDPNDAALGSDLILLDAVNGDPRLPFDVTINNNVVSRAEVADLSQVTLRDNNGIRGTVGIPLTFGTVEASIFSFKEARGKTNRDFELGPRRDLTSLQFNIATSTLSNGQVGTNIFLYDRAFEARYTSDLWGMEYNFVFEPRSPGGEGFRMQPIVGFRTLDIQERLVQEGAFAGFDINNNATVTPALVTTIDSRSENKIYAPQLGLRMEMVHRWFTLGFEPKIGFGANVFDADVTVQQLRSATDPTIFTQISNTKFSPIGDFKLYTSIPVTEDFSLFASYQFVMTAKVLRPHDSIFYNDNGPTNLAAIIVREAFDNMYYRGYTIGGEWRWK